ncbi:MAG: glycosyltransferase family 2 protein [Nitrospirota bacterium]
MEKGISATVITYNEEENIRECLESLNWVDEIIVVDSFSGDETVSICREFGAKVYQHKWRGFAYQKNLSIEKASNEWILSIDADERVTPELCDEIKGIFGNQQIFNGYYIPRKNYFLGREIRYGGWYPDYTIRFFNRQHGRFGLREVHEKVCINGETGYLQKEIKHYSYRGISEYILRMDRYAALSAIELKKKGVIFSVSDLLFRPPLTLFKMYILKQGFRDGIHGLLLAGLYASYTFLKYAKLWEIERV